MPDRKVLFGCTTKARRPEIEIEDGVEYHYHNCPLHFVSRNIWEFMKIYKYQKSYSSAIMPSYKDVNPLFIRASNYYESKLAEYTQDKDLKL